MSRLPDDGHVGLSALDLVSAARSGDKAAYATLFQRYQRFAARIARECESPDVQDAVAESFRRTIAAIESGHGPVHAFLPYLATAVRTVVIAQRKLAAMSVAIELDQVDRATMVDEATDPEVAAAFAMLPAHFQDAIWQVDVEGIPPRQAASMNGLPTANAMSARLKRARAALRLAYLNVIVGEAHTWEVRDYLTRLVADGEANASIDAVAAWHLDECADCRHVASRVAAVVPPSGTRMLAVSMVAAMGFAVEPSLLPGTLAIAGGGAAASGGVASGSSSAGGSGSALAVVGAAAAAVCAVTGLVFALGLGPSDAPPGTTTTTAPRTELPVAAPAPSPEPATTLDRSTLAPLPSSPPATDLPSSDPPVTDPPVTDPPTAPPVVVVAPNAPPQRPPTTTVAPHVELMSEVVPTTSPPTTLAPTTAPVPNTTLAPTTTVAPVTTTTTTSTTTTTTTTTTPAPAPVGALHGYWFVDDGVIVVSVRVDDRNGEAGTIRFSTPVSVVHADGATCGSATECSFAALDPSSPVTVYARAGLDPFVIELLDANGNVDDSVSVG